MEPCDSVTAAKVFTVGDIFAQYDVTVNMATIFESEILFPTKH